MKTTMSTMRGPGCRYVSSARCGSSRPAVNAMDEEGFGGCTNYGECSRVCPQEISIDVIGMLNREYRKATLKKTPKHPPKMVAQ